MNNLPKFLFIGPMKSGTSWVYSVLKQSEQIELPKHVKETFFFDRYYKKGIDWYKSQFNQKSNKIYVEVGPSYFHSKEAPERISLLLNDVKIIVITREPISRSWSHYKHLKRYGYTNKDLDKAIIDYPEIIYASCYKENLERWGKYFKSSNILVLNQDEMRLSPKTFLKKLSKYMDIDDLDYENIDKKNLSAVPKYFFVAKIADRTAHFLRRIGLYAVIEFGRRIGLRNMFFGKPGSGNSTLPNDLDINIIKKNLGIK